MQLKINHLKNYKTEKLLELLTTLDQNPKKPLILDDCTDFIIEMNLRSGKRRISFDFIYNLYLFYSSKPVSRAKLGRNLKQHFTPYRNKYGIYYLLSCPNEVKLKHY